MIYCRKILLLVFTTSVFLSGCIKDEDVFSDQDQFFQDLEAIDTYLGEHGIEAEIDPVSGISYVVHEQGEGLMPAHIVDSVTIDITGKLLSTGGVFQSEVDVKKRWSRLLTGAAIALNQIQEGGSVTAYIPSHYAYGSQGAEGVPANAIIELELRLHEVHDVRLRNDITAINDTLEARGITAAVHPSGIRYVIHEPGTGTSPTVSNLVTVNYEGWVLGATSNFDSGENITFELSRLVPGWKVILPLVREGGSVTMYLPSIYGYGPAGSGSKIPQNAILTFDMDLISVE